MKPQSLLGGLVILLITGLTFNQCTHDDEIAPTNGPETGDAFIDTEGAVWRFDKSHSNIEWETAYLGQLALLTGRFQDFDIELVFDEANPTSSTIAASVTVSSNTTGEPFRDGLGRCMPTTLGVVHNGDTLTDGSLDPAGIEPATNVASFTSDNISRTATDTYLAKGFLAFKGITSPVDLTFTFGGIVDNSDAQDGTDLRASFVGELPFFAKTIHGVESNNIADEVMVKINCQVRLR